MSEQEALFRARIETLLNAHEKAGDFLRSASIEPDVTLDSSPSFKAPDGYHNIQKVQLDGIYSNMTRLFLIKNRTI